MFGHGEDGRRSLVAAHAKRGAKKGGGSKKGATPQKSRSSSDTALEPEQDDYLPNILGGNGHAHGNGNGNGATFANGHAAAVNGSEPPPLAEGVLHEDAIEFLPQSPGAAELDLEVIRSAEASHEESAADFMAAHHAAANTAVTVPNQHLTNLQLQQYLKPLPRVLLIHTGGTLGMDPNQSYMDEGAGNVHLKEGTGGVYPTEDSLQPGEVLSDLLTAVPELTNFAHLDVEIVFNIDSCRLGPKQWVQLAKLLDKQRQNYDAFLLVHGTDTMSFTAAALSLMLQGFKKPIVLTGSQLPLAMPRSDARQNLIDAITCATAGCLANPMSRYPVHFEEVAICFGGRLMRGNRARKIHSSVYNAFDTPNYPHLAKLGVEVEWDHDSLLTAQNDVYQPRFKLNPNVIRVPIVPGVDPRKAYGDLYERGVRGIVLEAFGVGNMPDNKSHGWLPWLKQQRKKGLLVYLCSQCNAGNLHPELYRSGSVALNMGVESGRQMTPECAVIKMMFCLEYKDIPMSQPIAGEL